MSSCQDPDLVEAGVFVDDFRQPDKARVILLSHGHADHLRGLTKNFSRKTVAPIVCTHLTMQLAILHVSGLDERAFSPITYGETREIVPGIYCTLIPAHHVPGSAMFHLRLIDGTTILHTCDFRFHPMLRAEPLFKTRPDRLYYDDTFDSITDEDMPAYPTLESTSRMLWSEIDRVEGPVRINCSVLGIETVLQDLAHSHGLTYSIAPEISDSFRAKQMKLVLGDLIDGSSRIVLGHRGRMSLEEGHWIVPTCTYFLCKDTPKASENVRHVPFCTHPNKDENDRFKVMINACQVNPCNFNVGRPECAPKK